VDLTATELYDQAVTYLHAYPWVWDVETQYGLPRGLLLAVGSRETNLGLGYANGSLVGDSGYGHGTWQEDDHPQNATPSRVAICERIQSGDNVYAANIAAQLLQVLLAEQDGNVDQAADRYNSGQPFDASTAGHDYGPDVVGRLACIAEWYLTGQLPHAGVPTPEPAVEHTTPATPTEEDDLMFLCEAKGKAVSKRRLSPGTYPAVGPNDVFIVTAAGKRVIQSNAELALYVKLVPVDRQYLHTRAVDCQWLADTPSV
jgi:hypothetical protein